MSVVEPVLEKKIPPMSTNLSQGDKSEYYLEDEISLIDLWLVLVKRKKLAFAVFSLCAVLGIITALVLPKKYTFTTSIEIGNRILNNNIIPIENPETILAKIKESYVPLAQYEYKQTHPNNKNVNTISARIPKGSEIIILESQGSEEHAQVFKDVQQNVVEKIKQDHARIIEILRKEIQIEANVSKNKLAELKDEVKILFAKQKRLSNVSQMLKEQIDDAKAYIAKVSGSRVKAAKEARNESKAMTLLMLDTDAEHQRERLAALEERLYIKIPEELDSLEKKVADNQRAQTMAQDQISKLESQLVNLRETRAIVPPMQSNEPTGISKKMIVFLCLVIGLVCAIFAVFFAEFLTKAHEQMNKNLDSPQKT